MSSEVLNCFNKQSRDFLVSVAVHKARNLDVLNADTFVVVSFDEYDKRTKIFEKSDCPFYDEYFAFEVHTSLEEVLKKNIRIVVFQGSCCLKKNAIIGEVNINLTTIWNQQHHAFIRKWAVLEKIGDEKKQGTSGYLQLDLSIVVTNEPVAPAQLQSFDEELIEKNLLLPHGTTSGAEDVKYLVNIFEGNFVVKRDYILQVSFGSNHRRSREVKYSKYCKWNEQLIFHGKFLSLHELFVFELLVFECYQWKVKCSVAINFSEMCWKVDDYHSKPAFGPAHIYFYEGVHSNLYFGKLLISIETEDIDDKIISNFQPKRDILTPFNETEFWDEEIFKINFILVGFDAVNYFQNRVKVYLNCESVFSNTIELDLKDYEGKLKLKFLHFDSTIRPLTSLSIKLPDNRLKLQVQNLTNMLVQEMETQIENYQLFEAQNHDNLEIQTKCVKMLISDLLDMLMGMRSKIVQKTFKKTSEWDENFLKFVKNEIEIFISKVRESHESPIFVPKKAFQDYISIRDSLMGLLDQTCGHPPDVFLNVTSEGKLVAFHRFQMLDYFYSQSFKGPNNGKLNSIFLKPATCFHSCTSCGCFFGKLDFLIWIGSDKEVNEWLPQNVIEVATNQVNFTVERFYKCNVFVHQAKIQPQFDKSGLCDAKLLITANGMQEKTKVIAQSLSAVWNETLVVENVRMFDIGDDKFANFPSIPLFLFDEDKRKLTLIGATWMKIPIKPCEDPKLPNKRLTSRAGQELEISIRELFHQFVHRFPPNLRWRALHKSGLLAAEVLLSAEYIQLSAPNLTLKLTDKNEPLPPQIKPDLKKFRIEVTFVGIRGASHLQNLASGHFKIELSMGELLLSSGFSGKAYKSNLNFLDPHSAGYLLLPEQFHYWPPILIKHFDCSRKTPTVIGAAMIRRPEKFFVGAKPKELHGLILNPAPSVTMEEFQIEEVIEIEENEPLLGHPKIKPSKSTMRVKNALSRCRLPKFLHFKCDHSERSAQTLEKEYTWWTKFYNSLRDERLKNEALHELKIFHNELEMQEVYENLHDWAYPIALTRGKSNSKKTENYATLKCSIKVTKCEGKEFFKSGKEEKFAVDFPVFKSNVMVEQPVVVRVYVVQAVNLRNRDKTGQTDAFIKIKLGDQSISDRAHYIPNQANPVFGKLFQFPALIPRETSLKISIYDRDTFTKHDLVGSTDIDIEDRIRTKYLATCGLPREYNKTGYNIWRNSMLPSEILRNLCVDLELSLPQYFPEHVHFAGMDFQDSSQVTIDGNKKERLALSVLNSFSKIPGVGFELIPEHVETRSLYRKDRPGIEQGKLLMWVEIFDPKKTVPEPIDTLPVPPQPFELRIVVWNTKDMILNEKNLFGTQMSDIYVKGWLSDIEEAQYTDIHYRSLNGEGNFNWRMIFPFKYSLGEDMMVTTQKRDKFETHLTMAKVPAVLNLQIWDNDTFSADDFLGTLSISLSHFASPSSTHENCTLKKVNKRTENLFANSQSIRGWFPVYGKEDGQGAIKQTGKLELELQVLSEGNAIADVVGLGREGPHSLPPPDRPDTSFNWISNPVQSVKKILWPQIRKFVIVLVLLLVLVMAIGLIVVNLPQKIAEHAIGL